MGYYTEIPVGALANAATFNAPLDELNLAISRQGGGEDASEEYLLAFWIVALQRLASAPEVNAEGVVVSANIIWPDGSTGLYESVDVDPVWLEATEWTLTHDQSGRILEFSGLIRNGDGVITSPGVFNLYEI